MAVVLLDSGIGTSTATATANYAITLPVGTAAGDVFLVALNIGKASPAHTVSAQPATSTTELAPFAPGGSTISLSVHRYTVPASIPATITYTLSAAFVGSITWQRFRGVDATTPVNAIDRSTGTTLVSTQTAPAITTSVDSCYITGGIALASSVRTVTVPSGWTADVQSADGRIGAMSRKGVQAVAGSSGTATWSYDGTATRSVAWQVALAPAVSTSTPVTGTRDLAWSLNAFLASPSVRNIAWDTYSKVSDAQDMSWGVQARVEQTRDTAWSVRSGITQASSLAWDTKERVNNTRGLAWSAGALVGAVQSVSWDTFAVLNALKSLTWDAHSSIFAFKSLAWDITQRVNGSQSLAWDTYVSVNALRGVSWDTKSAVGASRDIAWDIFTMGQITASLDLAWDVGSRITAVKPTVWNVKSQIRSDKALSWSIRQNINAITVIGWATRQNVAQTANLSWNTLDQVLATRGVSWSVLSQYDLTFLGEVTGLVQMPLIITGVSASGLVSVGISSNPLTVVPSISRRIVITGIESQFPHVIGPRS